MTASDHLGPQFQTWYHGTTRDVADGIRSNGLTASEYGMKFEGYANKPTVTGDRSEAEGYAAHRARRAGSGHTPALVELHVPEHLAGEYLAREQDDFAGLHKPLPPSMIHGVSDL